MKTYIKYIMSLLLSMMLFSCIDNNEIPHIKVFKSDSSIQCENTEIGLNVMALELINEGIDVICSQKGYDGLGRVAVCGAGTGGINVYTINTSNLVDAENIGFLSVSELSEYQDISCN